MVNWLLVLNDVQRRASLAMVEELTGIPSKVLEKDWWVTLILNALFRGEYTQYFVFKGGTSLSKCFKLINRFSEDIDIALSPEAFGLIYKQQPSGQYVKKLKIQGCEFTNTLLKADLEKQLQALGLPPNTVEIVVAPYIENHLDKDPQTLHVRYTSLFEPDKYIADEVKIEVGVRALQEPNVHVAIQSLLNEYFPNAGVLNEIPIVVTAVVPEKTFLEKCFLLHEEFSRIERVKVRYERMSRHLYDMGHMAETEIETAALLNHQLYSGLIEHRKNYSRFNWLNYDSLNRPTISFIPSPDVFENYRQDYQTMVESMIYEVNPLDFDSLIAKLSLLQDRFRQI